MTYNPNRGVGYFEPGSIQCACCGWKPEDPWDTDPEGFTFVEYNTCIVSDDPNPLPVGQWECDECNKPDEENLEKDNL